AWDEFVANQAQLRANSLKYREEQPGVARKGQALTSRDRTLSALWSFVPSALLGPRGANGPSIGVAPTRASLEEQTVNVCVRWLWMRRSNSASWRRCGLIN